MNQNNLPQAMIDKMQESPVLSLHLQYNNNSVSYRTRKQSSDIFMQSKLPRENCWQGCTAMIPDHLFFLSLAEFIEDGGQPKYAHVRHKFGAHPGPVDFREIP